MTKFLIAILLTVIGLKLIAEDALVYKFAAVKLASQDGESKSEKGDNEKSEEDEDKKDNEDKFYNYYIIDYSFFEPEVKVYSLLRHYMPDRGFADKPYTPPKLI